MSDCPIVRLSDCPIVRLSDCPIVRLSDCPIVRLSDCPIVRLSDCPIVRLSDCPIVRLWFSKLTPFLHKSKKQYNNQTISDVPAYGSNLVVLKIETEVTNSPVDNYVDNFRFIVKKKRHKEEKIFFVPFIISSLSQIGLQDKT